MSIESRARQALAWIEQIDKFFEEPDHPDMPEGLQAVVDRGPEGTPEGAFLSDYALQALAWIVADPENDYGEVWQHKTSGRWRYRIKAGNHRIVESPAGQSYATKNGAIRAARRGRPDLPVTEVTR